jgi:hypothetical protein
MLPRLIKPTFYSQKYNTGDGLTLPAAEEKVRRGMNLSSIFIKDIKL